MKDEITSLLRLAEAQQQLARLLEARIGEGRRKQRDLEETQVHTRAAVERVGSAGLAFYAAAMRRLATLDQDAAAATAAVEELTSRLIRTRSRQEVLQRRARELQAMQERKLAERDALELLAHGKASGKPRVIK